MTQSTMTKIRHAFIQQMPITLDRETFRWRLIVLYRCPDSNTHKCHISLSDVRQALTVTKPGYNTTIVEISLINGFVINITDDLSWIEAILKYE